MVAPAINRARIAGTALLLFVVALFLTAYSAKNPVLARAGATLFAELTGPVQKLSHGMSRGFSGVWENYIALLGIRKEMSHLKDRLAQLEAENSRLLELENENQRLRSIVSLQSETGLQGVAAEVVGYDPSNWARGISIDKGERDGVRVGMPVLEGNGVVGQVVAVAAGTSRVMLLVDHSSGVDAIVQGGRARGVVSGAGEDGCELRYVRREEELNKGDRVITSGMDGVYPKGLFLGIIWELDGRPAGLFRSVGIRPAVNFSRLETVFVVTALPPGERQPAVGGEVR